MKIKKRKNKALILSSLLFVSTLPSTVSLISCGSKAEEPQAEVSLDSDYVHYDKEKSHIELNKESTIALVCESGVQKVVDVTSVKVGGQALTKSSDYTFTPANSDEGVLIIKEHAMTSLIIKIEIKTEVVREKMTTILNYTNSFESGGVSAAYAPKAVTGCPTTIEMPLIANGKNAAIGDITIKNGDIVIGSVSTQCIQFDQKTISIPVDFSSLNKVINTINVEFSAKELFESVESGGSGVYLKATQYGLMPTCPITIPETFGKYYRKVVGIADEGFKSANASEIVFEKSSNIEYLGEGCFSGSKITKFTVPGNVSSIPVSAFKDCSQLTSVTLHNSLTKIEDNAFENTKLSSIDIPNSLLTICDSAFINCTNLSSINYGDNPQLAKIESSAFKNTGLTSFAIPESLDLIESNVFEGCNSLTSVTFADPFLWKQTNGSTIDVNTPSVNATNFKDCSGSSSTGTNWGYSGVFEPDKKTATIKLEQQSVRDYYFTPVSQQSTVKTSTGLNSYSYEIKHWQVDGQADPYNYATVDGKWVVKSNTTVIKEIDTTLDVKSKVEIDIKPSEWDSVNTNYPINISFVKDDSYKWIKLQPSSDFQTKLSFSAGSYKSVSQSQDKFVLNLKSMTTSAMIGDITFKKTDSTVVGTQQVQVNASTGTVSSIEVDSDVIDWDQVEDDDTILMDFKTKSATLTYVDSDFEDYWLTKGTCTTSISSVLPNNKITISATSIYKISFAGNLVIYNSRDEEVARHPLTVVRESYETTVSCTLNLTDWTKITDGETLTVRVIPNVKTANVAIDYTKDPVEGITYSIDSTTTTVSSTTGKDAIKVNIENTNDVDMCLQFKTLTTQGWSCGTGANIIVPAGTTDNPGKVQASIKIDRWQVVLVMDDTISFWLDTGVSKRVFDLVEKYDTQTETYHFEIEDEEAEPEACVANELITARLTLNGHEMDTFYIYTPNGFYPGGSDYINYVPFEIVSITLDGQEFDEEDWEVKEYDIGEEESPNLYVYAQANEAISSGELIITIKVINYSSIGYIWPMLDLLQF